MRRSTLATWLCFAGLLLLLATACTPARVAAPVTSPNEIAFVIPSGTEAALARGEAAFHFPDEVHLQAGQTVVVTNQDYAMHYFFDIPIAPGEMIRKTFPRSGGFVYQGGLSCSISRSNTIKVFVD